MSAPAPNNHELQEEIQQLREFIGSITDILINYSSRLQSLEQRVGATSSSSSGWSLI